MKKNLLKSNADKCHLLVSSSDAVNLRVSKYAIKNSECKKLLGVKFDKLTFEKHIIDICRKFGRKTYSLVTIVLYIALSKWRMLVNAIFNSQFNYCLPGCVTIARQIEKQAGYRKNICA